MKLPDFIKDSLADNRKRRVSIALFAALSLILIMVMYTLPTNEILHRLLASNEIQVSVSPRINASDIAVSWWNEARSDTVVVYHSGSEQASIPYEYGMNYFSVKHRDSIVAVFKHFKTNNWHAHTYSFEVLETDGQTSVNLAVNGPDHLMVQRIAP